MLIRMIARLPLVCLFVALGLPGPVGCASRAVSIDNPVRITAGEYNRMFEASVDVLRNELFSVERQDRRFGVITTRPLWAGSALEPWRTDNTTAYQYTDATLNYHRRTVRVNLTPRDADATLDAATPADPADDYMLEVIVQLDRRQHPPRELNTAAVSSVAYFGRSGGTRRIGTEAGAEESFWRTVGRDEYLEQRLVNRILARASVIAERHSTEDAQPEPEVIPEIQ